MINIYCIPLTWPVILINVIFVQKKLLKDFIQFKFVPANLCAKKYMYNLSFKLAPFHCSPTKRMKEVKVEKGINNVFHNGSTYPSTVYMYMPTSKTFSFVNLMLKKKVFHFCDCLPQGMLQRISVLVHLIPQQWHLLTSLVTSIWNSIQGGQYGPVSLNCKILQSITLTLYITKCQCTWDSYRYLVLEASFPFSITKLKLMRMLLL